MRNELERNDQRLIEEHEREDRRVEREARREEEREAREERLLTALREAQPTVPQTVYMNRLNLQKMGEKDDRVVFICYIDTALTKAKVPPAQCKDHVQP